MRQIKNLLLAATMLSFAACGGGSDGNDQGTLSLALTDAPVDNVAEVWLRFTGVTVKPQDSGQITFDFSDEPIEVDLLTLTEGRTQALISDQRVPAGPYNWIRFEVDNSYGYVIDEMGHRHDLSVPSERLRFVSGFTVTVNRETSFIIDWVARKALTDPVGRDEYLLRPAFRVVDATAYAAIAGIVHPDLIELDSEGCNNDPETLAGNTVYLYNSMTDAPESDFDDIYLTDSLEEGPLTTANVVWDEGMNYGYRIDFVGPGDYTLAFTCQGLSDEPDEDADIEFRAFVDVTIAETPVDVLDADFVPET
jgi:hypothetical protein